MTTPTRVPPSEPETDIAMPEHPEGPDSGDKGATDEHPAAAQPENEADSETVGIDVDGSVRRVAPETVNVESTESTASIGDSSAAAQSVPPRASEEAAATERPFRWLIELLHDLAIAVVVCVLLITYVVQAFKVQGTSMSPELKDGERILVNKLEYRFDDIERGDVVVFWYPEDPGLSFIKRVVGLPGETVEIRDGAVFIDGVALDELYVAADRADRRSHARQEIRPGHFFVLGDNRRGSNDSRSWGLVPERYIYGKAVIRIWPPKDIGLVE